MDRKKDKGKAILVHPTQPTKSSPMNTSSEEEKTEKLMSQSIQAAKTQNFRQLPPATNSGR